MLLTWSCSLCVDEGLDRSQEMDPALLEADRWRFWWLLWPSILYSLGIFSSAGGTNCRFTHRGSTASDESALCRRGHQVFRGAARWMVGWAHVEPQGGRSRVCGSQSSPSSGSSSSSPGTSQQKWDFLHGATVEDGTVMKISTTRRRLSLRRRPAMAAGHEPSACQPRG